MAKIKIVMADPDAGYIEPLELKFLNELQEEADVMIITDLDYFAEFFSAPQNLDILVINEQLWSNQLERQNIKNLFILQEQEGSTLQSRLKATFLYKYTSVQELFNEIISCLNEQGHRSVGVQKETRIIMVYSPVGGAGTTTVAMGLSQALAGMHRRVLFMGLDNLQTFSWNLGRDEVLPFEFEKQMSSDSEYIYHALRPLIQKDVFYYMPQFARSLSSLSITIRDFIHLAESVREAGEFDFIVCDTPGDFTVEVSALMGRSDHVITVTNQDEQAVWKLQALLQNIDCSDHNKYSFVCNRYDPEQTNYLIDERYIANCRINEYIERIDPKYLRRVQDMKDLRSFQKLTYLFN
jgi:cellulose biosynthesis protein BcsQ